MKKIFTLLVMALMAIGVQAQGTYAIAVGDAPKAGSKITSVDNITLTYGVSSGADFKAAKAYTFADTQFVAFTEGNGTNGSADGGTLYIFEPTEDGTITVCVVLNADKAFYVLEDGKALDDFNGIKKSEKYYGTFEFTVKAGSVYKVYCTGSKLGFAGFAYSVVDSNKTYEITGVTVNGTSLGSDDFETLLSTKALTIDDLFDSLPVVKYTLKTTTLNDDQTTTTVEEENTADFENKQATLRAGGKKYVITFTGIAEVLNVEEETTVYLSKEDIANRLYLSVTTDNWQERTIDGTTYNLYNLSSDGRKINIKVSGASFIEVFVYNTNTGRSYKVNETVVEHGGARVESSGLIEIPSTEPTVTIQGTGNAVYPFYVVFYNEMPAVPVTITSCGYATLTSDQALDFSGVEGLTAFIATGIDGDKVKTQAIESAPANTGLILKGEAGATYDIPVFTGNPDDVSANKMVGDAKASITLDDNEGYILSKNDGKFHPCSAGTLAAGKAYLAIAPQSAKVLDIELDDPTAISAVTAEQQNADVYNLQGVRVSNTSQKGVYIVNGKKIVK